MSTQLTDGHIKPRRYYIFPNLNQAATQEPSLIIPMLPSVPSTPSSLQTHLRSGLELYAQGETLSALWAFFEGVGAEPGNALGHYLCGLAFQALELAPEAQAAWETVLTLTAGEERVSAEALPDSEMPDSEMQWVRSMAERLVGNEAMSPSSKMPAYADFPSVKPEDASANTNRQAELETSILEDVRLYGNCYVKDRHIANRLAVTTEEQVVGWKQSFSAREGLECHPYQNTLSQSSRHEGVIFTRSEASTT
ncbi:MAG: hypothetical protein ACRYFS_15175 [Janthinobacterium lividum]